MHGCSAKKENEEVACKQDEVQKEAKTRGQINEELG